MNQGYQGQSVSSYKEALEIGTPTPTPFSQECIRKNVLEKTKIYSKVSINTQETQHRGNVGADGEREE